MTACSLLTSTGFLRDRDGGVSQFGYRIPLSALLALALLVSSAFVRAEVAIPPLTARVTDLAATLSGLDRDSLERRLERFEASKGSQIAVLIVPTTAPETIQQYGIRVAEAWKLGRKGVDDGVLVLVAKGDREMRIEVGRGLEGAIPDAVAKRIIADVMTPHFQRGDYYLGLAAGVAQIFAVVEGEPLPSADGALDWRMSTRAGRANGLVNWEFFFIVSLLAGPILLAEVLRLFFGRLIAGLVMGVGTAVLLAVLGMPIPFSALIGLFLFLLIFSGIGIIRLLDFVGWFSGYGSGGFRGGGGTFGGGGASGRW